MSVTVELEDVWFKYGGGKWVLKGVNQRFYENEVILVIGGTGCGKTTLARVISGLWELYEGELRGRIVVGGVDVANVDLDVARRLNSLVGQNPYLYFTEPILLDDLLSHAMNVWRDESVAKRAVNRHVEALRIFDIVNKYFFELSGGEARRALVAKSLISNPSTILFDEPLMWLDERGVNEFVKLVESLKLTGKTLIVFEHRFLPITRIADRILLLRDGRLTDVTDRLMIELREGVGRGDYAALQGSGGKPASRVVLKAVDIHHSFDSEYVLNGVELEVREGDFILLLGENGSGKTTLLRILAGYVKPKRGRVERLGRAIYIPQNIPLFFTESSLQGEAKTICRSYSRGSECERNALKKLEEIGVDPSESPFNISHGQQVKAALELSKLVKDVSLVLLDEPFSGLTYLDRRRLIKELSRSEKAKVVSVSYPDVAYFTPGTARIYRISGGRLEPLEPPQHSSFSLSEDFLKELYG